MDIEKLRKRVIQKQKANHWTFREMSKISGVNVSVLHNFVNGINPRKDTIIKIASCFYPNFKGVNKKEESASKAKINQLSIMKWG